MNYYFFYKFIPRSFRKLAESFFKHAILLNIYNENINLLNKEDVHHFDLAIVDRKDLIIPRSDGRYDFDEFYYNSRLDQIRIVDSYSSRLRRIRGTPLSKDWIRDNL